MKKIILVTALLLSSSAFAQETILSCGNQDPANPMHLSLWTEESFTSETLGQVSRHIYQSVNLICNNAAVLKDLKKDIICAGVDRSSVFAAGPVVISETILATESGYKWRGFDCN